MTATATAGGPLTVSAPSGAHFEWEEVKTGGGLTSLGDVPILVWDSLDSMVSFYGEEGVLAMADGTSLRVSFQSIARRFRAAKKSDDDIAKAQAEFKPGKRQGGASTPQSRVSRAARSAVDKGANADAIEKLLQKIAAGELSGGDLEALLS
jgi:hypothetical protein